MQPAPLLDVSKCLESLLPEAPRVVFQLEDLSSWLAALVWPQVQRALEETPTAESAVVASEEGCCICQGADDSHGK